MPLSPVRSSRALSALIPMLVLGLGLLGCGDNSTPSMPQVPPMTSTPTTPTTPTPPPPDPEPTTPDQPEEATYDIPDEAYRPFISANPLLQAVGATPFPEGVDTSASLLMVEHPRDIPIWEEGGMASAGLKVLAETGDAEMAIAEAEEMGTVRWKNFQDVFNLITVTKEITLNYENPCITYAQAIVPSPDWFVGFRVCAVDEETGAWLEEVSLTAIAWDAGTDDGDEYMAEDMPSDPQMPISPLDIAPFSPARTPVSTIRAVLRQGS